MRKLKKKKNRKKKVKHYRIIEKPAKESKLPNNYRKFVYEKNDNLLSIENERNEGNGLFLPVFY